MADRVAVCRQHLDFSIRWKGEIVGLFEMRRHYANYFKGLPDFKPYRMQLVTTDSYGGVSALLDEIAETYDLALIA